MATTSTSNDQSKSVDASLWWDSFTVLLTELEHLSVSSDFPPSMVKKLKENHAWFLGTVSLFKPPSQKSREALDSRLVIVGSHQLAVLPELKDAALKISSVLCLDEVQSYILVKQSIEGNSLPVDPLVHDPLHLAMLQYYLERQCLLKCTRQILMHALYVGAASKEGQAMRDEAQKLISDGLESRLLSVLEDLLSCSYPDHMDVDLYTLWAEEILIEDNLVLDNLFLAYYESFCTCNGQQWKRLCLLYEGMISGSYNFGKLALSTEATHSVYHAKVQLLLILVETLDLENLLQMIHDETPFRQGIIAFSVTDIQEIDAIISGLDAFQTKEAGPLILTWAVFLCLVSSLPEKQEYNLVMEIDHVGYVRQAFKAESLNYFLEILQNTVLKDSDGPIAGYRSILRTFISSFIASYEISLQLEDNSLKLILEILGNIYRGEESLCSQFWDRDSFIDGPIRCLLCNLEGEFPFRTMELVRLLSALAEGTWPAECVYTFLDKSVGLSSLFKISNDTVVDSVSLIVETQLPLSVPGLEGLVIPSGTCGHVLKLIDGNTALVRWEYSQSGVLVLLLRLAQKMYLDATEEVLVTLDLLGRLVTFNTAVCHALMDIGNSLYDEATQMNGNIANRVNVVEIICSLVKNVSPNCNGAVMMSMGVNILAKMLKCSPSHVTTVALKGNIFDVALQTNPFSAASDSLSSGSWLLSGRLAKMLLIDCEHNDSYCPLTLSVLDFTMQLVETGVQNDIALALVTFSIQYVLVNHEYWKYKVKHVRWNVTLKVLEVIQKCILSIQYSQKLGEVVRDILLCDLSVHSALFRIVCTTTQALEKFYISRHYELVEIEGLQLAISSVLDILSSMLSDLLKDALPSVPVFHQAVLSSTTKPIPIFTAVISLISCFRNPMIQVGAARVLSKLFIVADYSQPYVFGNACFGLSDNEIADFSGSIIRILREQYQLNEGLIVAVFQMLTSAADFQPAFLVAVIDARYNSSIQSSDANGVTKPNESSKQASFLDALLQYVGRSDDLIKSNPSILLNMLNFLKSLWQGVAQFANIIELLKSSANFWTHLSSILLLGNKQDKPSEILTDAEALSAAYKYQCQSDVLQIMAYEIFLQKKLLIAELQTKLIPGSSIDRIESADAAVKTKDGDFNDIFSTWCKSSELGHLIKSYASCQYDNGTYLRAKIAGGLLYLHVMGKLRNGDTGSLSVSLIEKIRSLSTKLSDLPAFSELVTQYSQCGYSDGRELNSLILSDLYYHMQGELEGRKIDHGPFKELSQYLVESKVLLTYQQKYDGDLSSQAKDVDLFDLARIRADLGLDLWDFSEWRESKPVAETMLLYLQEVNSMVLLAKSKISALKALISTLSVYDEDSTDKKATISGKIPRQLIPPFIDHICQCLHTTIESLAPVPDAREEILDFISSQVELLLHLIRSINKKLPLPTCVAVLKTSGSGLKVLSDLWPAVANVRETMKLLLMLLLTSVELSSIINSDLAGVAEMESVEAYGEASNASLGLLPILCKCTEPVDHCAVSLTTVDLILKGFLTPGTWFPIIQKHLQLQHLVRKLQDKNSLSSVPVILKFLLTFAHVREGAKLLLNAGFFASLRELFAELSESKPHFQSETHLSSSADKVEKPQHIWGLGLAVVTAVIHSLGGTSSSADIVDYVLAYFFAENSYLISFYLNTPYFPSDVNKKKTAFSHKTVTTLSALKETEQTLMLICVLAKHQDSWIKAMKVMDSQLRERSIHLLAFLSRANQRLGESPLVPLLCHPTLKEEFEWYKKPSLINSRNGWFALSPLGCGLDPRFSNLSSRATALVTKDQATDNTDPAPQTYFSDITAIQMYRITFLLLKFLCLQAEGAAKRAEEAGFVDIAHFPELPMPDILHGLQDQGIAIVYELCEANKLKQVPSEMQGVCTLLVQITEMALYLEFCVSQICGIKPVLGRVEDFSKELKLLLRGLEGQVFLKESLKSLKQIISFVYPGLLETEGFL